MIVMIVIRQMAYMRQLYKQQLQAYVLHEGEHGRQFRGVHEDNTMKGELFGVENLFQYSANSILKELRIKYGAAASTSSSSSNSNSSNVHSNTTKGEFGVDVMASADVEGAAMTAVSRTLSKSQAMDATALVSSIGAQSTADQIGKFASNKLSSSNPLQMELKVKSKAPIVASSAQKHRRVQSIVVDSDMENDEVDNIPSKRVKYHSSGEKKNQKVKARNEDDNLMESLLNLSPPRGIDADVRDVRESSTNTKKRMLPVSVQQRSVVIQKPQNKLYLPTY
mmetsp:Transcript_14805/g.20296  ORF Transcript_14805/g.20296 Transcript_14805/m.20296 type:complete len:280 (+) Transcript_14805:3-842(+)